MNFDFDEFKRIAARVYPDDTSYSFDEAMTVFEYFFAAYEWYREETHPPINARQILTICYQMPTVDEIPIDPDTYKEIIKLYFHTRFKNCNYRINHFFSGDVRKYRLHEVAYL